MFKDNLSLKGRFPLFFFPRAKWFEDNGQEHLILIQLSLFSHLVPVPQGQTLQRSKISVVQFILAQSLPRILVLYHYL